jgi:transcriptional regulator GlxA family with amidase domain
VTARGTVSAKHQRRILSAMRAKDAADKAFEDAVRAAADDPDQPASVRELAKLTGLAPGTINRIKRGD